MPGYTSTDLARIAAVLNVDIAEVKEHARHLDGARVFVEQHGKALPNSPTAMRDDLLKIAGSAQRLLHKLDGINRRLGAGAGERPSASDQRPPTAGTLSKAIDAAEKNAQALLGRLGVEHWNEAADGPASDIVDGLACANGTSLNRIITLTKAAGDLIPLLADARSQGLPEIPADKVAAIEELEQVAGDAADEMLRLGDLVVPKGHHGDLEVQGWIEDMARLYREVTGHRPTDWVGWNGQPSRFIRLLIAAGQPIGLDYNPQAWRRRVRSYLNDLPERIQK